MLCRWTLLLFFGYIEIIAFALCGDMPSSIHCGLQINDRFLCILYGDLTHSCTLSATNDGLLMPRNYHQY